MAIVTVNGILYERVDTTTNWETINPVLGNKEKGFERAADGTPIGWKMGNGILPWNDLPYWNTSNTGGAVEISTGTGSYTYTLNPSQLADVNAIGRIPNFVGLVAGQQFFDIYPQYTGSAGAYTGIVVQLHNDSEVHLVQFS